MNKFLIIQRGKYASYKKEIINFDNLSAINYSIPYNYDTSPNKPDFLLLNFVLPGHYTSAQYRSEKELLAQFEQIEAFIKGNERTLTITEAE